MGGFIKRAMGLDANGRRVLRMICERELLAFCAKPLPAKIIVLRSEDPAVEEALISDISRFANTQKLSVGAYSMITGKD